LGYTARSLILPMFTITLAALISAQIFFCRWACRLLIHFGAIRRSYGAHKKFGADRILKMTTVWSSIQSNKTGWYFFMKKYVFNHYL